MWTFHLFLLKIILHTDAFVCRSCQSQLRPSYNQLLNAWGVPLSRHLKLNFTSHSKAGIIFSAIKKKSSAKQALRESKEGDSEDSTSLTTEIPPDQKNVYNGPILPLDVDMIAGTHLEEFDLELIIAPSIVVPAQLGLYIRLAEGIDHVTLPPMTLLCGYARHGTFECNAMNSGGKTVGFILNSSKTAVFFERQLMSIGDALEYAAKKYGSCGLIGHELQVSSNMLDGKEIKITPIKQQGLLEDDARYFVPDMVQRVLNNEEVNIEEFVIQNFGQYSNDLAWDATKKKMGREEYNAQSEISNILRLVWRLEYNADKSCLVPSWPVSVIGRQVTFENNAQFMEVGTCYGWNYWHQTSLLEPQHHT